MKVTTGLRLNLQTPQVLNRVVNAGAKALKDVVTDIANDAIKGSPKVTGNNARSIKFEVGPRGEITKSVLEGAVYSTSGYGGYLETGTVKMSARPYFKPALDKHIGKLPGEIKAKLR